MPNIKYKETSWDTNSSKALMYVEFDYNGKSIKWYPKWEDLVNVYDSAWATEDQFNHKKLMDYFYFVNLLLMTRYLLIHKNVPHEQIIEFNLLSNKIKSFLSQ